MVQSAFKGLRLSCSRRLALLLLSVPLLTAILPGAVKLKNGAESALKLSDGITESFRLATDIFQTGSGIYSEQTLPRILLTEAQNPQLFFYTGAKLIQFDYNSFKITNNCPVEEKQIYRILSGPSADKVFLSGKEFSQFDLNAGKTEWTKDFGLTNIISPGIGMGDYPFPIISTKLPAHNQVMVMGLMLKKTKLLRAPKYANKIMIFDSRTGQQVSDREFHYRRKLSGSREIFINSESWEFEILDVNTLECKLKGKMDPGDLLFPNDHLAVDKSRLGIELTGIGKEICAHFLESGFIINSRDCYNGSSAIKESKWTIYDDNGNRVKSISPAPLTAIDYAVTNLGNEQWPVYMLQTYRRKMRNDRVSKIIALAKDGSWKEFELPAIEGIDEFLHLSARNWFHINDLFYYIKDGNIYTFKFGDKSGERLYRAEKTDGCDSVQAWDAKYIMLVPSAAYGKFKDAILVRLVDGKKVSPEDYNEKLDTILWKHILDFNQSRMALPMTGFTPEFNYYKPYNCFGNFSGEIKLANMAKYGNLNVMFTVWGDYRIKGKFGDIGIVPAAMKDKSTTLIGISIADNKPLFSVPVMEFAGIPVQAQYSNYPDGYYLPFNIIKLNENEALLIVLERIDLLKVYKLKRP